jgi:integrase
MIAKTSPPARGRLEILDTIVPALMLRITPAGAKTFTVRARIKGQPAPIHVTIGDAMVIPLADARREATVVLLTCRAGDDPRVARKAKATKAQADRANTLAAVAEAFIAEHVAKLRSQAHTAAEIRRYLVKPLGSRPMAEITVDEIGQIVRQIAVDRPHMARLILAHAKRLWRWASAPGRPSRLANNPCAMMSAAKDFGIKLAPRQVALSPADLRVIWQGADGLTKPWAQFVECLMLCGQRRVEVAGMQWSELDLEREHVWNIPASRMKSGRPHEVPLSPHMIDLLTLMEMHRAAGPYVFSTTAGKRPIAGFSKIKRTLDAAIVDRCKREKLPSPPAWRLHDLRRATRSGLSACGVSEQVAELCLAHVPSALVRTYDRHDWRKEKRAALTKWSIWLTAVVEGTAEDKPATYPLSRFDLPA